MQLFSRAFQKCKKDLLSFSFSADSRFYSPWQYVSRAQINKRSDCCSLIASGPSLKNVSLALHPGSDILTVSTAFLHPSLADSEINYHVQAPIHPPFDNDNNFREYNKLLQHRFGNSSTFGLFGVNPRDKNLLYYNEYGELGGFASDRIGFVCVSGLRNFNNYKVERYRPFLYKPRTVAHLALDFLLALGYKEIRLYGFDMDRVFEVLSQRHKHFHDELIGHKTSDESLSKISLSQYFYNSSLTFAMLENISRYANLNEIKIINGNALSWATMFKIEKLY